VDRRPDIKLLPQSGEWVIVTRLQSLPGTNVDPANAGEMTEGIKALHPVQPTPLTRDVDSVMPSRFASIIDISVTNKEKPKHAAGHQATVTAQEEASPSPPATGPKVVAAASTVSSSPAPVVHLSNGENALLVDYPHGKGRIVLLSDPYIFSNGGISLEDNLQLALNTLTSAGGLIAFDEYHQGQGVTHNAFVSYFSGTPVLAFCGQIVLLIMLVLWTRGRRFARPVPLPQVDRRSKLEFVASMAELQERAKAFDLAIENIYSRIRRVLARYAGVDYNSPRQEIANRVAARSSLDAHQLETLMRQCEDAINGAPINERKSLYLIKRLREIESALGLRMRSRDVKQAAQNI
jgi:hypothetical protein